MALPHYLVFVCVFVLLRTIGTYTHCTCCVIGLSNDVEAAVCVKLFKNHSFLQTKRFTFGGLSRKSAMSQPRRESIMSTTESP